MSSLPDLTPHIRGLWHKTHHQDNSLNATQDNIRAACSSIEAFFACHCLTFSELSSVAKPRERGSARSARRRAKGDEDIVVDSLFGQARKQESKDWRNTGAARRLCRAALDYVMQRHVSVRRAALTRRASMYASAAFSPRILMVRPQSSAAGVLALLSEPEPLLKQHALKRLDAIIPQFWAEISEYISLM